MSDLETTPISVQHYDLFSELMQWKSKETTYAKNRSWEIRSWEVGVFLCRLAWSLGNNNQMTTISKVGETPTEAVYLAIDHFDHIEHEYHTLKAKNT